MEPKRVIPQSWARRYDAAADRLVRLAAADAATLPDSLRRRAIRWADQCRGAAELAKRLDL